MAASTFSGPVKIGTVREGASANLGSVVLAQYGGLSHTAAASKDSTIILPANSRIIDIRIDCLVAYTAGTAATLKVGKTSGGEEYVTSTDFKSAGAGRLAITFTAAQLLKMSNIGSDTSIILNITTTGTTGVGTMVWAVTYTTA